MIRPLAVLVAAAALGGCINIVSVTTDGAKPRLSVYPFGVRVERGQAEAMKVKVISAGLGFNQACGVTLGVGVSKKVCLLVDADTCGVAILEREPVDPAELKRWADVADQTRAICLHRKD